MKILSSFTHPQVVPNLYECLCSAEHKGRYSEECGKQSSSGAPLTSIVFFSYYGSQWCPRTAWLQTFFKISSFVFSRTKTFIQVWNYLRVSKWWQNFHFWVNYPFNFPSPSFFLMAFALAGGRDNDLLLLTTCHSQEIASVSKRQQSNQFFMVLHIFLFREAVSLG